MQSDLAVTTMYCSKPLPSLYGLWGFYVGFLRCSPAERIVPIVPKSLMSFLNQHFRWFIALYLFMEKCISITPHGKTPNFDRQKGVVDP
jgi:hypothetical protein